MDHLIDDGGDLKFVAVHLFLLAVLLHVHIRVDFFIQPFKPMQLYELMIHQLCHVFSLALIWLEALLHETSELV